LHTYNVRDSRLCGCAIPFERPPETVFESELRSVAEFANSGGRVGLGILHVAGTRGAVVRRNRDAFKLLQQAPRLIQSDAPAIAGIEDFAGNARGSFSGLEVEANDVF